MNFDLVSLLNLLEPLMKNTTHVLLLPLASSTQCRKLFSSPSYSLLYFWARWLHLLILKDHPRCLLPFVMWRLDRSVVKLFVPSNRILNWRRLLAPMKIPVFVTIVIFTGAIVAAGGSSVFSFLYPSHVLRWGELKLILAYNLWVCEATFDSLNIICAIQLCYNSFSSNQ